MRGIDRETLETFTEESFARLARVAGDLKVLAASRPTNLDILHRVFRDTHSLKSAASLLELKPVGQIAHRLEDILEQIRTGVEEPDEELVAILRAGFTRIEAILGNLHLVQTLDAEKEIAAIDRFLDERRKRGKHRRL